MRARITTLIANAEADVAVLGEQLDQLYADGRFAKASNVRQLGDAIELLVEAFEKATVTTTINEENNE